MFIHSQSGQMLQYFLDCLALKIVNVQTEFDSLFCRNEDI